MTTSDDSTDLPTELPAFDDDFQATLVDLFLWRRDERHFKTDALPKGEIDDLLKLAALAPSVGNSQPWRFVKVNSLDKRRAIRNNFEACNAEALADYQGEKARLYASLKLEGMDKAPEQIAVFVDTGTDTGLGLGQKTMPETLKYSVVGAVNMLWLASRARGIGLGWVSIIDPVAAASSLDVPDDWSLVAYLCIGYPEQEHIEPELQRLGWQERLDASAFVFER
jgi:5,6-dimethylbenzimidazole synthase